MFHEILLDNLHDAFQRGVNNFSRSISHGLTTVGYDMSCDAFAVSAVDVPAVVELLQRHLQGDNAFDLYCPRAAPTVGVVRCTYHQWFRPYSKRRRYCQLPVSGRRMQRFLQFRLSSHSLPIAVGRFAGGHHVARADRICSHCGPGSLADELHLVHECPVLQPLRLRYAGLFTPDTGTMRSFFGQKNHMQVFSFILDCLDFLKI